MSDAGVKYDDEKLPYHLVPFDVIDDIVRVQQYGAKKYTPNGWQTVPNGVERYISAAFRHMSSFQQGQVLDTESGLPHLTHALCSLMYAHYLQKRIVNENHNRTAQP